LLFQFDNLEVILFKIGLQKSNFRESPPIGNPKYTNGKAPTRQFRAIAASYNQEPETFTPVSNGEILQK